MRRRIALWGVTALMLIGIPWVAAQVAFNPDVNRDGVVTSADVAAIRGNVNRQCGQAGFLAEQDLNGNCRIDLQDVNFATQNLNLRITASATPAPNGAGWNRTDVTVSFTCAGPVTSCEPPATVAADGAGQVVTGAVVGRSGARMTTSVTVNLDKTAPGVTITSPAENFITDGTSVEVLGTLTPPTSPLATLTCNGVPATVNAPNFSCSVPLVAGSNGITVTGTDAAGNTGTATRTVRREVAEEIRISATPAPAPNAAGWNNADVTVTFACSGPLTSPCPDPVVVATEGEGQVVSRTVTGPMGSERTASVTVNLDKTAPAIAVTSPVASFVTDATSIELSGPRPASLSPLTGLTCNGVPATLTPTTFSCVVPLVDGDNTIGLSASDAAGNTGTASHMVRRQDITISSSAAPPPNGAGWNNSDVTVTFTCGGPVNQCPSPVIVSTEAEGQVITGTVSGPSGAQRSASSTVSLDKTAPVVTITSPDNFFTTADPSVVVTGPRPGSLSPLTGVTCNGVAATLSPATFSCTVPLQDGENTILVSASDAAANTGTASRTVRRDDDEVVIAPVITITTPTSLALFNGDQSPITVTGTVDDPNATVLITVPEAPNGVLAGVNGNTWQASNVPLREGHNIVTAKATTAQGGVATAIVTVNLDTTEPVVRIDGPTGGATLTDTQVIVTGVVNDIVSGTVNSEEVTVSVNGVPGTVSNRSFVVSDVLLVRGVNTLTAVARDRAGNQAEAQITVTVEDPSAQQRIEIVSGNSQTSTVGTLLPEPLVARLLDVSGRPIADRAVRFRVVRSDGTVRALDQQGQDLTLQTDSNGEASVDFLVGSRTGVGNNQVAVSSVGFNAEVIFSASATVGAPVQINPVSGENQRGEIGKPLTLPFLVIVYDGGGNPVGNVPVTFRVLQGGGLLEGAGEQVRSTNSDGKAEALLTLGLQEGISNQVVDVSFAGSESLPVVFTASALIAGAAAETRVSGVVLDNTELPIVGAVASIAGTGLTATTDAQGRFSIGNAPVGTLTLIVDGSTSDPKYPFLAFMLTTVSGTDNTIGMPIYIPALDTNNSKIVGGAEEVVLTMEGVPGVAFTIAPNSTTLPDGRHEPVRMMLSQVHADKVPMPPPNGSAPRLVWTLQPANVRFDPPIRVQLPNTDGLAPGQVVEIFQFDHDLEQFVSVGPARVSADGSVVVSDPGFGITKSGWGAPQPPPPPKNCTASCNDHNVCTSDSLQNPPCTCSHQPSNEGASCGGANNPGPKSCVEDAACANGQCVGGMPKPDGDTCDDDIFCTEPDQCGGGSCSGTKIDDKEGPAFSVEIKVADDIGGALKKLGSVLGVLKEASVTFTTEGKQKNVCCEDKMQKDVPIKTLKYQGNAKLETDKLFIPSLSFNVKFVKIGVFVKFGLTGSVFLEGENDLCADNKCFKGGIQIGGSVEGGVAAEAGDVASISGSCALGLQVDANVSCKEYQIGLSHSGFKCKFSIELFDGYVAFNVEKELVPPGPIVGGTPTPLPDF